MARSIEWSWAFISDISCSLNYLDLDLQSDQPTVWVSKFLNVNLDIEPLKYEV